MHASRDFLAATLGFVLASVSNSGAATFRFTVDSPPILTDLATVGTPDTRELGSNVASLYQVTAKLSGTHSNGWWVGDQIESHFSGPMGAMLDVYLFVGSGIQTVGLPEGGWYHGEITFANDGQFSLELPLTPTWPYLVEVPFVPEKQVALTLVKWPIIGFGAMVLNPYLKVSQVEIQVADAPGINLALADNQTTLSWSVVPFGGTVEILSASNPSGPWEVALRVPSERHSVTLGPTPPGNSRYFRLKLTQNNLNAPIKLPASPPSAD